MALSSDSVERSGVGALLARLKGRLGGGDNALAQRMAGTAFLIRVASAAIAYLSQIVLARWMGSSEFGLYVYVWTWVLLIGGLGDLGLAIAAQRFVPEYGERGALAELRGYLAGSRALAMAIATALALSLRSRSFLFARSPARRSFPLVIASCSRRSMRSPACRTASPLLLLDQSRAGAPYIVRPLLRSC